MNTRQLEYVITIAEEGSFSKAAKRLIISQPSLSQYVQKLEEDLGAQLFVRSSPLRLTTEGRVYVEAAKRILQEEDMMKRTIADIVNDQVGELTIGAGQFNNTYLLPYIVKEFQCKYPGIKVTMKETVEPKLFDMLERGSCDLVVTTMDFEHIGMLESVRLGSEDYIYAVPKELDPNAGQYETLRAGLPANTFPLLKPADYKELPFIFLRNKEIALHTLLEKVCRQQNIVPRTVIDCDNTIIALRLVEAGAGLSVVPSSAARFNAKGDINFYAIDDNTYSRHLNIVYNKERYLSKSMQYFIDITKKL